MKRFLLTLFAFVALAGIAGAVPPPCPTNITPTPTSCWAYNEVSGTTAFDAEAVNDGTFTGAYTLTGNGVQFSAAGQVNQPPANNAGGVVSTALAINPTPSSMTVVISFAGTGGGLLQLSNGSLAASSSQNAILYLSNYGTAIWGVYNFGLQPIASSTQPGQVTGGITGVNYGDGNPHIMVASVGAAGMKLYADGHQIASNPNTQVNGIASYWTVGAANTTLWPASPGNINFNGTIYYAAVYQGTQLTDAQALAITGYAPPTPNNIPYCQIFGNVATLAQNLGFVYANQNITFATNPSPQLPNGVGAQVIAPSTTTIQTDAAGNLPSGFQLPQGAHVMMTIGSGTVPSRQIPLSIPLQLSVEFSSLVLAEVDPPQVVSEIDLSGPLLLGWSVLNPAPGQIGPATIVSPNSVPTTCGTACTISPSTGPIQTILMTANVAINLCGQQDGQYIFVDTVENATGGWSPTFSVCAPFTLVWNNGNGTMQPAMPTTAANARQVWQFIVEGNTVVGGLASPASGGGGGTGGPFLSGSKHLLGDPDGSLPLTTIDLSAQRVIMLNSGATQSISAFGFAANDLVVGAQTGAVVNKRDQTAAFGNNVFFYVYAIGGTGQPAASIASLTTPDGGGPTLPTNYTAWVLLGVGLTDGSGNLVPIYFRGTRDYYKLPQNILSGGSATTSTNVAISSLVPPIATSYELFFQAHASTTSLGAFFVDLGTTSATVSEATAFYPIRLQSQVTTVITGYSGWVDMPYVTGGLYYLFNDPNTLTLANLGLNLQVNSFTISNGSS